MLKQIKLSKDLAKQVKILSDSHHCAQVAFKEASHNLRESGQKMWDAVYFVHPELNDYVCNVDVKEMTVTPLYPKSKKED